ncbi:MAG UNVERIFIED_CONTAM: hypothetical protein LVR18_02430 [Planctomycetaceae bacterium]
MPRKTLWQMDAVKDSLSAETRRPDYVRRAVDVNRPVTPWWPCCGTGWWVAGCYGG